MVRSAQQRLLLIGDDDRQLQTAVAQTMPGATVRHAADVFDAIAELTQDRYAAVLASIEPINRRPEAAVRTLRELAGEGRVILFGDASMEPLSRRMLQYGCDDYLVTPISASHVQEALTPKPPAMMSAPPLRLHTDYDDPRQGNAPPPPPPASVWPPMQTTPLAPPQPAPSATSSLQMTSPPLPDSDRPGLLAGVPVADIIVEALLEHPGDVMPYAISQLNTRLASLGMRLSYLPATAGILPQAGSRESPPISYSIQGPTGPVGSLLMQAPPTQDSIAHELLAFVGPLLAKTTSIQRRQTRLQKLAFTDDLTGLFNCRYFKHFLARTLADARKNRFPVTLFLFDIDNFKSYNDRFGHAVGDDILKQTSDLMRRCVRDHDLVARIGGDEFAVVFWEKEGPRQSRDVGSTSGRPPSEPQQILARFQKLLQTQNYPLLGSTGRGTLTISGGLAVYPYDASDLQSLIDAADKALMFGAKRSGRNSIALVAGDQTAAPPG